MDYPISTPGRLMFWGIVAGAALLLWEAFGPADYSAIVSLRHKLALAEERALNTTRDAEAATEHSLAMAQAEAEAYRTAYEAEAQANASIKRELYGLEADTYRKQQEAMHSSLFMDRIGVNVASTLCMLNQAGLDEASQFGGACSAKTRILDGMLSQYPTLLEEHRSDLPEQRLQDVRTPREAMEEERNRLMREWDGNQ